MAELTQAADRAGAIVSEQIRSMMESAESRAQEIRVAAEQEAEQTRAQAAASAGRILDRIDALERPLSDLVISLRRESDRLGTEAHDHGISVESSAEPITDDPTDTQREREAEEQRRREEDQRRDTEAAEQRRREEEEHRQREEAQADAEAAAQRDREEEERKRLAEADEQRRREDEERRRAEAAAPAADADSETTPEPGASEDEPAAQETFTPAPVTPPAEEAAPRRRGFLRRRGKQKIFITEAGACAVCQRTFAAGSQEALDASGWRVSGDVGLCPECQADGWQLPEGARLPFRRGTS
jgi:hypothetical protein